MVAEPNSGSDGRVQIRMRGLRASDTTFEMLLKPNQGSQRKTFTKAQYPQHTLFLPYNSYGTSTGDPFLDVDVLTLSVENATLTLRFSGAFTNLPSLAETAGTRSPDLFNQFVKGALDIGASIYTGDVRPALSMAKSLFPTFELADNEIVAVCGPPTFPAVICQKPTPPPPPSGSP